MTKLGVRSLARRRIFCDGSGGCRPVLLGNRLHQATHDGRAAVGLDVDGHAGLVAQDAGGPLLQDFRCGRLVSAQVAVQESGIACEHIVGEKVAGQPLQRFQAAHQIGLDLVARALQLGRLHRFCAQIFQLLVDDGLQLGQRMSLQGDIGDFEGPAQQPADVNGRHGLRKLQFKDQTAIKARALAAAQHVGQQIQLRVAGREIGHRVPGLKPARQIDLRLHGDAALGGGCGDGRHRLPLQRRPRRNGPEIFVHQAFDLRNVEIAGDEQHGIVGCVVAVEERSDVSLAGRV